MNNFLAPGVTVELTAPAGGVVSGNMYKIGQLLVVAAKSAAVGERFNGQTMGKFTLPKATGQTWAEGALVYWDDGAANLTTTSASNQLAGAAIVAAGSGDTTGVVRLNGIAAVDS